MISKKCSGFTLIELIIVITILAIFAGIAIPVYSGYISKSKDAIALQNAASAYKLYFLDNITSNQQTQYFVYEDALDRILGIKNGIVLPKVHGDIQSAMTALLDDPNTPENEATQYGIVGTSVSGLYAVMEGTSGWKDASVVFVGDSITAGSGTSKTYHAYIGEMGVFQSVTEMGVPGSCISAKSDYGYSNSPLISRYSSIPDSDLIVVFMGTNDYGHETPLGSSSDTTDISFYGALNVVISGIQMQHPDSQLVFVTPLHRYGFGTSKITGAKFTFDSDPNGRGHALADYVAAIKAVCARYSVPVIDLFNQCPINPSNSADKAAYFPDGLHPNAEGHEIIAELILRNLNVIPNQNSNINNPPEATIPDTTYDLLQHGNKFVNNYVDDPTRASSVLNIYLEKGQTVKFKGVGKYQWALAKTDSAYSTSYARYYPNNGWNGAGSYTVEVSGYYGLVLLKTDKSEFDFGGLDSDRMYDYFSVE